MWISIYAQKSVSELSLNASFESFATDDPSPVPGKIAKHPYQTKLDIWVPDGATFGVKNSISQMFLEDGKGYTASSILTFADLSVMGCRKPTSAAPFPPPAPPHLENSTPEIA